MKSSKVHVARISKMCYHYYFFYSSLHAYLGVIKIIHQNHWHEIGIQLSFLIDKKIEKNHIVMFILTFYEMQQRMLLKVHE